MLKKLALIMLLLILLCAFAPACKPFPSTAAPGIEKETFKDPGLKDRDSKLAE